MKRNHACPYCVKTKHVKQGVNDLFTTHPSIAVRLDSGRNILTGREIVYGTKTKYYWVGEKELLTPVEYNKKHCALRTSIDVKGNVHSIIISSSITVTHPEIVAKFWADERNPAKFSYGSNQVVTWGCDEGHNFLGKQFFQQSVKMFLKKPECPYCSGRKVLTGFNDVATTHPFIAERIVDVNLRSTLTCFSTKTIEWL